MFKKVVVCEQQLEGLTASVSARAARVIAPVSHFSPDAAAPSRRSASSGGRPEPTIVDTKPTLVAESAQYGKRQGVARRT